MEVKELYKNSQYYFSALFILVAILIFIDIQNKGKKFVEVDDFYEYSYNGYCSSNDTISITTEEQRENYAKLLHIRSSRVTKAKYIDFLFAGSDGDGNSSIIFNFEDSETGEIFSVIVSGLFLRGNDRYKELHMNISFFKENHEYILFLTQLYPSNMDDSVYIVNDLLHRDRTYYELTEDNDASKVAVGDNYNVLNCSNENGFEYIQWSEMSEVDYISGSNKNYDQHFMEWSMLIQTKYDSGDFK